MAAIEERLTLRVPVRRRRRPEPPTQCCVLCHAVLRDDHATGDLVCDYHPREGYAPRHDPRLEERILILLWRAGGETLNLCRALGAFPRKTNHDAIEDAVARINRAGYFRVVGKPGWGYQLALQVGHRRRT